MSLRINSEAPNFTAETTQGVIDFHQWIGDRFWITTPRQAAATGRREPSLGRRRGDLVYVLRCQLGHPVRWKSDITVRSHVTRAS